MHVLLIERHQLLARALKRGLEEEGYTVHVACGSDDDIEALTADCDAIIFDPMLHKESDLSLPRRWRLRGIGTPILVLTTPGHNTNIRDIEAAGFLPKPFDLDELLARLRALTWGALAGCCENLP
jgi:DNA-binding response OmpR family regulator